MKSTKPRSGEALVSLPVEDGGGGKPPLLQLILEEEEEEEEAVEDFHGSALEDNISLASSST